jgi:hypothetical protein
MNEDVKEIDEIVFGVYSAEEIIDMSVCKIDNPKLCNNDKNGSLGTVYDPRLGTIENGVLCTTCNQNLWECPGHFGYISLNEPVIHPLYYKQVVNFLKCFCTKCYKLLITEDQIVVNNLNRIKGVKRFNKILERLDKIDMCTHCSHPQPAIKHTISDNTISMVYKDKDKHKVSIILQVDEIKKIFDNISVKDVELMGFNPNLMQPKNLILTVFPVVPTCFVADTFVLTNNGYKYIQKVDKYDMLYTHKGNFKKINDFQVKDYEGELINIKTAYHVNTIKCTPEHPFYVKEIIHINGKTIGEPEWVNASKLSHNHFIGMKRNKNEIIPIFTFEKKNIPKFSCGKEIEQEIKKISKILNNLDEWFLIGYFVGDGWIDFNAQGRFYLSMNEKDKDFLSDLLTKLKISFHSRKIEEKNNASSYYEIFECHDFRLWNILKQFGHLDFNKLIPNWVHDSPCEFIESFLNGYVRNQTQISTISPNLAFSTQLLYMKLGILSQINTSEKNNGISKHLLYNISIVKDRKKDLNIYLIDDDYFWFKITNKSSDFVKDIKVYNFEVDEDNTYCVENLITHNCVRPYVISDSNMCDDDLTIQLVEIIKANNHLEQTDGQPISDTKKQKYLQSLKFRIATFYNNSCLAPDTPVLIWEGGFKRADEIEYGDELIGDDGEKRIVQAICSGEDEMFEIEQRLGEKYIVNSNHYLTLKHKRHKKIIWQKPSKKYKNGKWVMYYFNGLDQKVKNFQISETLTKEEAFIKMKEFSENIDESNIFDIKIKDYIKLPKNVKDNLAGFKLHKSINWESKKVLIDPYILGMWLGDGNSNGTGFTSENQELIDYWKKYAETIDCEIVLRKKKLKDGDKGYVKDEINFRPDICFGIKSKLNIGNDKSHSNPFKYLLNKYNLIENKHIPVDYIYNDEEIRMKLLAGFIDTDGFKARNAYKISQTSCRKHLIEQVKILASSLGYQTSITKQNTKWKITNGEIRHGEKYIIHISGYNINKIPVILKSKRLTNNQVLDTLLTTISVKPIGTGKYNGFVIDKNHRFLLGDFTVTHNSGKAKHSTNGRAIKGIKERLTGKHLCS